MAKQITFNGQPIAEADAVKMLAEIYGDKRPAEIISGLKSGRYGCASVAGGHLVFAELLTVSQPPPPAES